MMVSIGVIMSFGEKITFLGDTVYKQICLDYLGKQQLIKEPDIMEHYELK